MSDNADLWEQQDIEAEAEFWREHDGTTGCLGLVAQCVMLVLVVGLSVVMVI